MVAHTHVCHCVRVDCHMVVVAWACCNIGAVLSAGDDDACSDAAMCTTHGVDVHLCVGE